MTIERYSSTLPQPTDTLRVLEGKILYAILALTPVVASTCITSGAGPPVVPSTCANAVYYSQGPNPGVWLWDSVNSVWDEVIAPG